MKLRDWSGRFLWIKSRLMPPKETNTGLSREKRAFSNLSTTQRYLGKVSDTEASRWVENIFS